MKKDWGRERREALYQLESYCWNNPDRKMIKRGTERKKEKRRIREIFMGSNEFCTGLEVTQKNLTFNLTYSL